MENHCLNITQYLTQSALSYSEILNCQIILESDEFEVRKTYTLKFFRDNFLHLTGLQTNLSAKEFFDKCLLGIVTTNDYYFKERKDKTTVKKKLKNLVNINRCFMSEVKVQESFIKNNIVCAIATCDGKCTVGFIDAKSCFRPKTILANDHLDKNKKIIIVKPIIK